MKNQGRKKCGKGQKERVAERQKRRKERKRRMESKRNGNTRNDDKKTTCIFEIKEAIKMDEHWTKVKDKGTDKGNGHVSL